MMQRPRAVLFDLDGVLIDSYELWFHLLNQTALELGYPEISQQLYLDSWASFAALVQIVVYTVWG